MRSKTSSNDLLLYFLTGTALTVPFLVLGALAKRPDAVKVNLPWSALMAVCPVTAAAILTYRRDGWAGVRALIARAWDWRRVRGAGWLLAALLTMPAVLALSYAIMRLAGRPLPSVVEIPWRMAPVFLVVYLIAAAAEELGWTAYATDPLQARVGLLRAALILGAVWAGWHIIPYFQADNPPGWVLWQCVFTVASRVLIVWIYDRGGYSVMLAILYHAMYNVAWTLFPNYGSHYDPLVVGLITLACAAGVVAAGPHPAGASRKAPTSM